MKSLLARRRRLLALLVGMLVAGASILTAGLIAPTASAAAPAITVDLLTVPTSAGTASSVNASARARSTSGTVTVQAITIAVRNSSGAQFDFPGAATNVAIPTSGYTFTSGTRTFPAGTYSAFVAVQVGGVWYNLTPTKSFTVGGASSGVVVDSLTLPTAAAGQNVTASARVRGASTTVNVQAVTIAARNASGAQFDFPGATAATVTTGGYTFTSGARSFTAGSYDVFVAVQVNGTWYNLDPHKVLVVGASTSPGNLVFASEFNAAAGSGPNQGLSASYWLNDDCWKSGCTGTIAQYRENHARQDGAGNLVLTADTNLDTSNTACGSKTCKYASSRLTMQNWANGGTPTFARAGGHFEARMKLPTGAGLWPAFWTVGDQTKATGAPWPVSGEIDILEALGNSPTKAFLFAHGGTVNNGVVSPFDSGDGYPLPSGTIADWHTYAVDWDASNTGYIKWSVDGKVLKTLTASQAGAAWKSFQGKHSIILNLAVGGVMPGDSTSGTTFPAKMYVDYVRVYDKPSV